MLHMLSVTFISLQSRSKRVSLLVGGLSSFIMFTGGRGENVAGHLREAEKSHFNCWDDLSAERWRTPAVLLLLFLV